MPQKKEESRRTMIPKRTVNKKQQYLESTLYM